MFKIIQKRKFFFVFSGILCLVSILSLSFWGLKLGIDFTGGALMELEFKNMARPEVRIIREKATNILGEVIVQETGTSAVILKFKNIDEDTHQRFLNEFKMAVIPASSDEVKPSIEENRYETIGPSIGRELKKKALWAIILVNLGIIIYIGWAFRKVSKPVASWKYGLGAIIALVHDILITLGLFSLLGHFFGAEVDSTILVALLTILGYSVNDTIVLYDRIRENLLRQRNEKFEETINESVNQNLSRCINTSLTTEFVLLALYFFGGETIKYFSLALIFGIFIGTYSSIFIASALIVEWGKVRITHN
ncbi:MAG: preprotein translocase subunit SecF [Parcubacteria group bacterium Athens1014_10]|nr:MAG: preprotein translocase subunit SecF [Parcubacteria group bacterium Athens1014_10]TSD04628.1 MAG: preprotein translocase subunit SecF [Parcubacteria group bacterium Athens0714_12]